MKTFLGVCFTLVTWFTFNLLADGILPTPSASPEMAKVVQVLEQVNNSIPMDLASGVVFAIAFAIELLVRFMPTAQPRSILLLVSYVFNLVGSIFTKLSLLLDKIVQNIKEPVKK